MKIKIETKPDQGLLLTEASRSAIQAALDASNGKAIAFTIHDAHDIADVVEKADDRHSPNSQITRTNGRSLIFRTLT